MSEVSAQQAYEWVKTSHWNKQDFFVWLEEVKAEQYKQGHEEGSFEAETICRDYGV